MYNESMAVELYLIHTDFLEDEEVFRLKLKQVTEKRRSKVLQYKTREDQKRSLAAVCWRRRGILPQGSVADIMYVKLMLFLPETSW